MQENRLLLWTKGKFKLIASSRMATCYHPTHEGMGIRAGHSIRLLLSPQLGPEFFRVKPIYNRLHRNNARLYGTTFICNIRDGFMANLHFVKVQIICELIANNLFDFFFIHSLANFSIDVYNFVAVSVKNHRYYKDGSSCACKVVVFIARKVSAIYLLPP